MSSALPRQHSFGVFVRKRREKLGLTLEQLAERAGLSPNYIGILENGKRTPSLSSIIALAKGLSVSPSELIVWWWPKPPTPEGSASGTPAQFEIPFISIDRMQEIVPWLPRRSAG